MSPVSRSSSMTARRFAKRTALHELQQAGRFRPWSIDVEPWRVLQEREDALVADEAVLDRLGQRGTSVSLGLAAGQGDVEDRRGGVVERPEEVATDPGKIDPTLAADRGVDEALRGDGHHDQRHAPQPDRRGEDGRLEHGLVTDRDQWVTTLESELGQPPEERLLVRKHLGGFAVRELLDVHRAAGVTGHAHRRICTRAASRGGHDDPTAHRQPVEHVGETPMEDALAELDRPIVERRTEDERAAVDRLAQHRIDAIDRRRDRAGAVDAGTGRVVGLVLGAMAQRVRPEIALDLEIGPSDGPQPLHELVGGDVEPDHVSASEEPSPQRGVGDDPVRSDHPAQRRAGVWRFSEADPRDDIRSPGRIASEVHEPGAASLGQGPRDTSGTAARCPDQHGFHRPRTMPRRPSPCRRLHVGNADEMLLTGGNGSVR